MHSQALGANRALYVTNISPKLSVTNSVLSICAHFVVAKSRKGKKSNKHNAELQRADPGTKVRGNSVLGVVFSHTMPKLDFRYSHRFS